jgi:precorrin-6B C5,15-methyltransferase / cobalt-precorrin-6B C5,C15-methyltransferase
VIDVVGLTARGWPDLPEPERAIVRGASLVVGGRRLLGLVPLKAEQRAADLPRPLRAGLRKLVRGAERVVVLASGDPLLAGIGTVLLEELGTDRVRIHPAVSSVVLARARMGWSAESVVTLSLVARSVDRVRRVLVTGARLILLSSDHATPATVSTLLVEEGYGDSVMTVLGDLGTDEESRISARAADWSATVPRLNLICVSCLASDAAPVLGWTAGLPDDAYEHDGQLTKRDVRAAVLARLAPRPGELLWDLGAGAGSVAIEWCRADPGCRAIAVERDPDRLMRISRNAARLGVPDLNVVGADIDRLELFEELRVPDAIFVGGGANQDVIERCWSELGVGKRLVVAAVTVETEQLVLAMAQRYGGELVRIGIERVQPLGRFRGWLPARPVVLWCVVKVTA